MKRVYTAETLIDGQLMMDLLKLAGVPCLLFNQNAVGGLGDLPVTYPEVWVKRDLDLEKARRTIADFENSPPPATDKTCATCGEHNPATFEVCWRCDAVLKPALEATRRGRQTRRKKSR